ncbi:MAG: hypothetical protein ACI4CT_04945 [Lachnospiraceae bacterium]
MQLHRYEDLRKELKYLIRSPYQKAFIEKECPKAPVEFTITMERLGQKARLHIHFRGLPYEEAESVRLYTPKEILLLEAEMENGAVTLQLPCTEYWSPDNPVMYTLLLKTTTRQFFYEFAICECMLRNERLVVNDEVFPGLYVYGLDRKPTEYGERSRAYVRYQMYLMKQCGIHGIVLEKSKVYENWIEEIAMEQGLALLNEEDLHGYSCYRWLEEDNMGSMFEKFPCYPDQTLTG